MNTASFLRYYLHWPVHILNTCLWCNYHNVMSGTQGRDPIILEGQAAETSVCSYLSCCRICLHLAGTRRDATLRGGCHLPPLPVMKSTSRRVSGIVWNCFPNREVLKIQRGLKPIRPDPPVISPRPTGKNQDAKSRWWYGHSIHPVLFITMMIMRMRMRVRAGV